MRFLTAAAIIAATLLSVSCMKDQTILYKEITMAQVTGPATLLTDAGLTYHITNDANSYDLTDKSRVLIYCNVLKKTADKVFDIELIQLVEPLNKDAVLTSTLTKPDDGLGNDPVGLASAWVSAGYLNVGVGVLVFDENTMHKINLEFDDTAPQDTLRFVIRHDDGLSDTLNEIADDSNVGYIYATFPIQKLLPEGVSTLPIKISWTWDKNYCLKDGLKI